MGRGRGRGFIGMGRGGDFAETLSSATSSFGLPRPGRVFSTQSADRQAHAPGSSADRIQNRFRDLDYDLLRLHSTTEEESVPADERVFIITGLSTTAEK